MGKLLLISDLEGCQNMGGITTGKQSRIMCDPSFFKAIQKHLNSEGNKVAFLGDYFDQGDLVEQSIIEIMKLYDANPGKVHIILGNRDVNKLRLAEEMAAEPKTVGADKWLPIWGGLYNDIATKPYTERLALILGKSMGAGGPAGTVNIAQGVDQNEAGWLLIKPFSDANAKTFADATGQDDAALTSKHDAFINACRKLFQVGRVVAYDPDFKTIMSHAGGMEPFFFHNADYYADIESKITAPEYYSMIEQARVLLQNPPASKPEMTSEGDLTKNLKVYNDIYLDVAKKVFGSTNARNSNRNMNNSGKYMKRFALVQALGLKPDPKKHFVSFIQTCDIMPGCKGPVTEESGVWTKDEYSAYQRLLGTCGVKVIASGHVPHCAPVPLIYRRQEIEGGGGPIFVCSDTSNGSRPEAAYDMTDAASQIESLPLAYVESEATSVGVGTLPDLGPGRFKEFKGKDATEEKERLYDFTFMLGRFDDENMPVFVDTKDVNNHVQYPNGKLTFPARTPGKKMFEYSVGVPGARGMGGGRRRKQKTRKSRKAARKGRKTRKY